MVQADIAVLRFGLGARPGDLANVAGDPRGWLREQLRGPVPNLGTTPLAPSDQIFAAAVAARKARREMKLDDSPDSTVATQVKELVRAAYLPHYREQVLARAQSAALTPRPFAERLVHFWSNHFAVSADKAVVAGLAGTLENEAIRPHVNGNFSQLLLAVEQHPAMLAFLDNPLSVGPGSPAAQRAQRRDGGAPKLGINENLAREILELHTLGIGGGYSQQDVTRFAEVLTGWSVGGGRGRLADGNPGRFYFRDNFHEPGPKTLLGKRYLQEGRAQGEAVLADLARNPATAEFIATKLTRHFVADDPPPATVHRVARAFLRHDGDLPEVYSALIDAPHAWEANPRKFKTPEDFVFSTLRALSTPPQRAEEVVRTFDFLGQRQYMPGSPAGWPDSAKNWDGSDALMHRVLWAAKVAERYDRAASPLELTASALGGYARADTVTAVQRAASGSQALALLLMSPEFQRR